MTVGLHRFEANLEFLRRLQIFVPRHPAHKFKIAGLVAQNDRRRRVPKLMASNADADLLLDRSGDANPKAVDGAHALAHAREKIIAFRGIPRIWAETPGCSGRLAPSVRRRAEIPEALYS